MTYEIVKLDGAWVVRAGSAAIIACHSKKIAAETAKTAAALLQTRNPDGVSGTAEIAGREIASARIEP